MTGDTAQSRLSPVCTNTVALGGVTFLRMKASALFCLASM